MSAAPPAPLDSLLEQLRLLLPDAELGWAAPAQGRATDRRRGDVHLSLTVAPTARRPRLLLPTGRARTSAAAVLVRSSAADGLRGRAARAGLACALLAGAGTVMRRRLLVRSPDVPVLLGDLARASGVPVDDLTVSVSVGAARANAKPVLAVHDTDGRVVLWAKVATHPLTRHLVTSEHAALHRLAALGLRRLSVPTAVGLLPTPAGPALLMRPLTGRPAPPRGTSRLPVAALAELAAAAGTHEVSGASWAQTHAVAARDPELLALWCDRHAATPVSLGAWHGDWGPWNMSWAGDHPQVWDWERYATGVPVGVDAVHYAAHTTLRQAGLAASEERLREVSRGVLPAVLGRAGARDDAASVDAVVDAYLLLLHERLATEGQTEPTGAVLAVAARYAALLRARLTRSEGARTASRRRRVRTGGTRTT